MSDVDEQLLEALKTARPMKVKVILPGGDEKTFLSPGGRQRWSTLARMVGEHPWQRAELLSKSGEILAEVIRRGADLDIGTGAGEAPAIAPMQMPPKLDGQPDWLQASVQMMGMFMPMHSALLNQHLRGQQLVLEEHRKWTDAILTNVLSVLNTVTNRVDSFERAWGKMLQFSFDTTKAAAQVQAAGQEGTSAAALGDFVQFMQWMDERERAKGNGAPAPAPPGSNGQTAPHATPAPVAKIKVPPPGGMQ